MRRFEDKVVIITGGGSRLGQAAAVQLASEGAKLALVDANEKGLLDTKNKILEVSPNADVYTTLANVTIEEDVQQYVDNTVTAFGKIDGFFNNAYIEGKQNTSKHFESEGFLNISGINLNGIHYGLKHVLQIMKKQGFGKIVNIASVSEIYNIHYKSSSLNSKHSVVQLTRQLGLKFNQLGITINAIVLGAIIPPMIESHFNQIVSERTGHYMTNPQPKRRSGKLEDIAHLVAFLLSDNANSINTAVIPFDGGKSYLN